jgi:hypothetical protein
MSAREDLEACETILRTMMQLRQADAPSIAACLRLIKRAASELEEPAGDDAPDDEPPPHDATTTSELRERWPGSDDHEKAAALDNVMGVTAFHTAGTAFDAAAQVQILGVPRHE